jgi:hypothetical protein
MVTVQNSWSVVNVPAGVIWNTVPHPVTPQNLEFTTPPPVVLP